MNLEEAAEDTLEAVRGKLSAMRYEDGNSGAHACWMLEGIRDGYVQHEKGHRWLGYAQGLLVAFGELTLDEAKRINKRAS